jgi:hypothetical protein
MAPQKIVLFLSISTTTEEANTPYQVGREATIDKLQHLDIILTNDV